MAQLGMRIPKSGQFFSSFCHELMNLIRCSRKKKKPEGFCFTPFHRNRKIFGKLDAAVAIVRKENKHHGLFFREGRPGDDAVIHAIEEALGDVLARRLVEGDEVGRR